MIYKLFYVLFNSYYKHGDYKKAGPLFAVWLIFALPVYCLILLLAGIVQTFIDPGFRKVAMPDHMVYVIMILLAVCYYLIFIYKKKYNKIYHQYKNDPLLNSKMAKILSFSMVIIMVLLPFIYLLLRNKLYFGEWT